MKKIFSIILVLVSFQVQAGWKKESMEYIFKAISEGRSIVKEVDIMKRTREAHVISRTGRTEAKEVYRLDFKELGDVDSSFQVFAKADMHSVRKGLADREMDIILDIHGIDHITKAKIKRKIAENSSELIGHYAPPRLTQFAEDSTSLTLTLRIKGYNAIDLNHVRGVKKIIDDALKITVEGKIKNKVKPVFSRKDFQQMAVGGSR